MTRRIDAKSKRRFHSSMIDQECRDFRRTIIVYFALRDFFRIDFHAFSWKRIRRGPTNADIKSKCVSKLLRHLATSLRAPNWERSVPAQKPSRKPQVRDSNNMVGVK